MSTPAPLNNTSSTTIRNALASSHAETSDVQETIHPGPSSLPYDISMADTSTPAPLNNTSRTTIVNALAASSHAETSNVQETIQPGPSSLPYDVPTADTSTPALNNTSRTTIANALAASSHAETSDVQETIQPGPSSLPYDIQDSEVIRSLSPPRTGQLSPPALSSLSVSASLLAGAYNIQEVIRSPSLPHNGERRLPCLSTNEPLGATHQSQPQPSSSKADSSSTSHKTMVDITLLFCPNGDSIGNPYSVVVPPRKRLNVDKFLRTREPEIKDLTHVYLL